MTSSAEHWETVYTSKSANDVSWYENEPTISLRLISSIAKPSDAVIDIGGGASSLAERLIAHGYVDVTVLDISQAALANSQSRFESADAAPHFVVADITGWIPERPFDVWHDRAVFHFMVTEEMRDGYKRAMSAAVSPGGYAIIGTFALDGPEQCSGITVARYSAETLRNQFGEDFELIDSVEHVHRTPWDSEQHFVWVVLRRRLPNRN